MLHQRKFFESSKPLNLEAQELFKSSGSDFMERAAECANRTLDCLYDESTIAEERSISKFRADGQSPILFSQDPARESEHDEILKGLKVAAMARNASEEEKS